MRQSVDLEVKGTTSPPFQLEIALTNRTGQPLKVYEHSLPWVGTNSLVLVAAKTDALGTLLEKLHPVDDPGPATTTIEPGETRSGRIELAKRFPDFDEAFERRDVVVFWSYQCAPIDGSPLPRSAGAVIFSHTS